MKRKHEQILAVFIMVGVFAGILIVFRGPDAFAFVWGDFEWDVNVEETFQFEIKSWGNALWGNLNESDIDEIHSLNGTIVNVTITHLPALDNITDLAAFENDIVTIPKISCIFNNGSEIPDDSKERIIEAVSGCILPVGSWSTMDTYHPTFNQTERYSGQDYLFSELLGGSFEFGWIWIGPYDDSGGWNSTISLESGFPSRVTWWYSHQAGTTYLELSSL